MKRMKLTIVKTIMYGSRPEENKGNNEMSQIYKYSINTET